MKDSNKDSNKIIEPKLFLPLDFCYTDNKTQETGDGSLSPPGSISSVFGGKEETENRPLSPPFPAENGGYGL